MFGTLPAVSVKCSVLALEPVVGHSLEGLIVTLVLSLDGALYKNVPVAYFCVRV